MNYRVRAVRVKSARTGRVVVVLGHEVSAEAEPREVELAGDVYAGAGVGVGDLLDEARVEALVAADERHRCRVGAWGLLARRPRARAELRRALRQRRFAPAVVDEVLADLEAKGFLDDSAFARQAVEQALESGRAGPRLVRQRLASKGVAREIADKAMGPVEDTAHQRAAAEALLLKWQRRPRPDDPAKRHQAAAAFLLRRGFDPDIVWDCVEKMREGDVGS
jgi:regulatory protein